jgi:acylphosphatase
MADTHHETVHFSGRVQGVGFRYAALQVAKEFEVSGFVENLPDGRVIIEAEGAPSEIDAFVSAIEDRMHGYIRKTERSRRARSPQFSGFQIR